jgi:hypothetical protein
MTHLYLDISAVRIQSYLSRTPQLKGRRGASAAIAEATRLTDDAPVLKAGGARINAEAGQADGVINLVLDLPDPLQALERSGPAAGPGSVRAEPGSGGGRQADTAATALAREVFAQLRQRLPGAYFQAVWGIGESYLQVHHDTIGPRLARGDILSDLPPAGEFPYAVVCQICHQDPATGWLRLGADEADKAACADCRMRHSRSVRKAGEGAERDLAETLCASRTAQDFAELARLGGPDTDRNHLGTVFIDGNAFSDFFHHLSRPGNRIGADAKTRISQALNAHTRTALARAAGQVSRDGDDGLLCVVPHLVGGDDVLVSLPADRAWPFTRRFLQEFGQLAEETRQQAGLPGLPTLSASAGLVFAHASYPFHLVVEEAEARLRAAKSDVRGEVASVNFTDLTADGPGSTKPATATLTSLDAKAAALDALARLPASLRTQLAAFLRDSTAEERSLRVNNIIDRLGHRQTVAPFWPEQPHAPNTPRLAVDGSQAIPLEEALRIVRWWR